jgi:hypothetical protein
MELEQNGNITGLFNASTSTSWQNRLLVRHDSGAIISREKLGEGVRE